MDACRSLPGSEKRHILSVVLKKKISKYIKHGNQKLLQQFSQLVTEALEASISRVAFVFFFYYTYQSADYSKIVCVSDDNCKRQSS